MKTTLASICLNESEFIESNLRQHYGMCDEWVIVEGACRGYPPDRVTEDGLSTDGTADIIRSFPDPDKKITFIQHGWTTAAGESGKSELRNKYASRIDSDVVIVTDIDELLTHNSQRLLLDMLRDMRGPGSVRIPHIHAWKNVRQYVTGGYFDIPHDRAYRWLPGSHYLKNHNHPENRGRLLQSHNYVRLPFSTEEPFWFHVGFCKGADNQRDKTDFYIARGERESRPKTIECREGWFGELPPDCKVHEWNGPVPEALEWMLDSVAGEDHQPGTGQWPEISPDSPPTSPSGLP